MIFRINLRCIYIYLSLIAMSCNDNSNVVAQEEHTDAEGLILELNGNEVYREFEGAIITNNITLGINEDLDLSVHFLDNDGDEIEHEDEEGDEDELNFQISNTDIISIVSEEHEEVEGDGEHHALGFELTGLSSGITTFTIKLMHEGHADYTSFPISVTVE